MRCGLRAVVPVMHRPPHLRRCHGGPHCCVRTNERFRRCLPVIPQLVAARRCAVLAALQHARTFHKHVWAQTAIEVLVEHCWQNK